MILELIVAAAVMNPKAVAIPPAELELAQKKCIEGDPTNVWNALNSLPYKYPKSAEPVALMLALAEAQGNSIEAQEWTKQLGALRKKRIVFEPPTPPPAPALSPPAAGSRRYINEPRVLVRGAPNPKAGAVGSLAINSEVTVDSAKGEWVKVTAVQPKGSDHYEISPEAATRLGSDVVSGTFSGWVLASHLSEAAITLEQALAEAEALEKQGYLWGAHQQLERAAAVRVPDPALRERAIRTAFAARNYGAAMKWCSSHENTLPIGDSFVRFNFQRVRGCRGDRTRAVMLTPAQARGKIPADACIIEAASGCVECNDHLRRLEATFTDGPYLRADLTVFGPPLPPERTLHWYSTAGGTCGYHTKMDYVAPVEHVTPGVPLPAGSDRRSVWLKLVVSSWQEMIVASSHEEAKTLARQRHPQYCANPKARMPGGLRLGGLTYSCNCAIDDASAAVEAQEKAREKCLAKCDRDIPVPDLAQGDWHDRHPGATDAMKEEMARAERDDSPEFRECTRKCGD